MNAPEAIVICAFILGFFGLLAWVIWLDARRQGR